MKEKWHLNTAKIAPGHVGFYKYLFKVAQNLWKMSKCRVFSVLHLDAFFRNDKESLRNSPQISLLQLSKLKRII